MGTLQDSREGCVTGFFLIVCAIKPPSNAWRNKFLKVFKLYLELTVAVY